MFDSAPILSEEDRHRLPGILFSVKGAHAGPRLVISGADDALVAAAEKLWDMPELVAIRGSVELRQGRIYDFGGYADDMFHLRADEKNPHLRILGRMTALGMISGRGVPLRFVA